MRLIPYCLFFSVLFSSACGGPSFFSFPQNENEVDSPVDFPAPAESGSKVPFISSLMFTGPGGPISVLTLTVGQTVPLELRVSFDDGRIREGVAGSLSDADTGLDERVSWFSNNSSIVAVSTGGVFSALKAGRTNILVSVLNAGASLEVLVSEANVPDPDPRLPSNWVFRNPPTDLSSAARIRGVFGVPENPPTPPQPQPPQVDPVCTCSPFDSACACDPMEHFLGPQDGLEINYGVNAGYGAHLFPDIVYGFPYSGGQHVISFGGGGVLTITLHGRILVDGPGPDFTVFENPILSPQYGNFAERAQVWVSATGDEGDYVAFPCDALDLQYAYAGCAGVTPVNVNADPRDPSVLSGDSFDLADLGIPEVRSIRIVDANTCNPGDPSFDTRQSQASCSQIGAQGFDLDAIAIINKHNE